MKQLLSTGTLIFSVMCSGNLLAQGNYLSLGAGLLTFDLAPDSYEPVQFFGRLGHDYNDYFGLGAELGTSLIEDEINDTDYGATTTFLYARGRIPIGNDSSLYAMFGATRVELTVSSGSSSSSADDDDVGFGFGYETRLDSYHLFIDYVSYYDDEDIEVSSVNIGLNGYF